MTSTLSRKSLLLAGASLIGAVTLGVASMPAMAVTTATSNFGVSATVDPTCLINAGTPLAFGHYNGAAATGMTTISVTCTNTTSYNVGLDAGTTSGATVTTRKMAGATGGNTDQLPYSLYSDSSRTVNWGNTPGTDTVAGVGTGSTQTLTVYGSIPASTYITPDNYTDTVTATVSY
ncbi:MAG: spore coat U domain-containing protein [Rhodopila sp.]|nr:spore coat U domain-containing protein [Rhodopila sp.]